MRPDRFDFCRIFCIE